MKDMITSIAFVILLMIFVPAVAPLNTSQFFEALAVTQETSNAQGRDTVSVDKNETDAQATSIAEPKKLKLTFTIEQFVIAIVILILLGLLFYLLLRWSQKSEQASYLGQIMFDSVREFEYSRLAVPIRERWEQGEYHREVESSTWYQENPRPEEPEIDEDLRPYFRGGLRRYRPGYTRLPGMSRNVWDSTGDGLDDDEQVSLPNLPDELKDKADKYRNTYNNWMKSIRKWEKDFANEAQECYQNILNKAREDAEKNAKRAIDVDLAVLRGRGGAFVLEFTAVVVIIFSAVILGVLSILEAEQIGTLLAAIAGYVLGRATTRSKTGSDEGSNQKNE